ncbi:MAG TPA: DUF222 domain-containing protein [Acidimicrobiales bacterium]|nr:DUF222 domain-containing protein [Acidimicrobiales bacterium]
MALVSDAEWLLENSEILDRGMARWLLRLAEFDAASGWEIDGQNSCVEWLMHRARMARSTAFERVQVARALRHRPALSDAFREGRISYSAARVMARMMDPDREVDLAVLRVAEHCPLTDVERMVRQYQGYMDQDRPPRERIQPSVRIYQYAEGLTKIESILPDTDAAEVLATINLFASRARYGRSATADNPEEDELDDETLDEEDLDEVEGSEPDVEQDLGVGQSAAADSPPPPTVWAAALMDMTRAAAAHTGKAAVAADRYLMHVVVDQDGVTTLPDGTRIAGDEAARVACDCSIVVHHYKDGQPLYQSRRTRKWNTAQRRAALVRDGGHCRFPGCQHRIVDLHHHQPWDPDGKTDIDNGFSLCRHHHGLLHTKGFQAHGEPNGELRFYRPDRGPIGTTTPVDRTTLSFNQLPSLLGHSRLAAQQRW